MLIEIRNADEFAKYIASGNALVDFNAVWCGPCRMLAPVLEELENGHYFPELKILSVDVDKVPEVAARYGINLIPTLFFFENGVRTKVTQGYKTLEDLIQFIEK